MCGIAGFSNLTPANIQMAPFLAIEMQHRGSDAWGCTNGELYYKASSAITDTWDQFNQWREWTTCLWHTRAATVGAKTQKNAHPFFKAKPDGKMIIGVHNGGVSNWRALNAHYNREAEVDSEHIFYHLADDLPLADLSVHGAVVWYEGGVLHFCRTQHGSLEVARSETDNSLIICSTSTAIRKAARLLGVKLRGFFNVLPEQEYYITPQDGMARIFKGKAMKFGDKPIELKVEPRVEQVSRALPFRGRPMGSYTQPRSCPICFRSLEVASHIVCPMCFDEAKQEVAEFSGGVCV